MHKMGLTMTLYIYMHIYVYMMYFDQIPPRNPFLSPTPSCHSPWFYQITNSVLINFNCHLDTA